MTLRCKPGDLAMVIRSAAGNDGRIVRCIRYIGDVGWYLPGGRPVRYPTWKIDSFLLNAAGVMVDEAPDHCLCPIRDPGEDAQDETLDWLPVPQQERSMA